VKVAGPVTRGRYARKAASLTAAEDSGVLMQAGTDAPAGAFGVFLASGADATLVPTLLFGMTHRASPTAPTITGLPRVLGLAAGNANAAPTTQFDLGATMAVVRDPLTGATLVLPTVALRTLDVALPGPEAGGRDQAAAFGANVFIHVYLIAKPDGTYHLTASLTAPPTGPALPSGYSFWAYCGALRIDNSSAIIRARFRGAWTLYDAAQSVLADGRAIVETAVSVASVVPATALTWQLHATGYHQTNASRFRVRIVTGQEYTPLPTVSAVAGVARWTDTLPNVSQQFLYLVTQDQGATTGLNAYVRGFENPIA
jgi:hypothetical protein